MNRSFVHVLLAAVAAAGCSLDSSPGGEPSPPPPPPPRVAPNFVTVGLPTWPPLSADGEITVRVTDDEALARISASFRDGSTKSVRGKDGTVSFFGHELGEGMGTLLLTACDERFLCRTRTVSDLLIDMTPPDIVLERAVVSPRLRGVDGQVALWVSDGWVLGSVDLSFNGRSFRQDFPHEYPSTLGVSQDVSRVAFAAKDFPTGAGEAVVVARDAAGNERTERLALRIDATLPVVHLLEPAEGAQASGALTVRFDASDDGDAAPSVDVWVGGARVLSAVKAGVPFVVDTSTLPPGRAEVRAVARDEAGNESDAASVMVDVVAAAPP